MDAITMRCICGSQRYMHIFGVLASCTVTLEENSTNELPNNINLGGGNDLICSICAMCGRVRGTWPLPEDVIDQNNLVTDEPDIVETVEEEEDMSELEPDPRPNGVPTGYTTFIAPHDGKLIRDFREKVYPIINETLENAVRRDNTTNLPPAPNPLVVPRRRIPINDDSDSEAEEEVPVRRSPEDYSDSDAENDHAAAIAELGEIDYNPDNVLGRLAEYPDLTLPMDDNTVKIAKVEGNEIKEITKPLNITIPAIGMTQLNQINYPTVPIPQIIPKVNKLDTAPQIVPPTNPDPVVQTTKDFFQTRGLRQPMVFFETPETDKVGLVKVLNTSPPETPPLMRVPAIPETPINKPVVNIALPIIKPVVNTTTPIVPTIKPVVNTAAPIIKPDINTTAPRIPIINFAVNPSVPTVKAAENKTAPPAPIVNPMMNTPIKPMTVTIPTIPRMPAVQTIPITQLRTQQTPIDTKPHRYGTLEDVD